MFDAPVQPREEENITMQAGFGFFPPISLLLATYDFSSGESGHAPLDVVTGKEIGLATGALVFILLFFAMIF